jgi:hypothetical protein
VDLGDRALHKCFLSVSAAIVNLKNTFWKLDYCVEKRHPENAGFPGSDRAGPNIGLARSGTEYFADDAANCFQKED